jgi:hypothetical protein
MSITLEHLLALAKDDEATHVPDGSVRLSDNVVSKGYWFTRKHDDEFIKVKTPSELEPEDNIFAKGDIIPTDVLDAINARAEQIDCSLVGAPRTNAMHKKDLYRYWLAPNKDTE